MARAARRAAQAAAASLRSTRIPNLSDNEDVEMADEPPQDEPTPHEVDEDREGEEEDDQNDAEEDVTPSRDFPRPSRSGTPRRGRGSILRGKKRMGRPPKKAPAGSEEEGNEMASDAGTPKKRGGFRGGRGGGRWAKHKAGLSRQTQPPVDDHGNVMEVANDEVVLPDDPEGVRKVDTDGYLQDGRQYRVRTFTILGRGKRLYMLSTEPARCIGFRDSYLFFQKHKHLYKILIDDDEKRDLIERDIMPNSYKGRQIGVVTARSVYREFGARIVIGGKRVIDDYDAQSARDRGDVEGELAVPEDQLPGPGETYNRNQYVAWHGASQVYHTNLPGAPPQEGKSQQGKRRRIFITSDNWMLEHARNATRFNSQLSAARKENSRGLYDIHTNTMHWPSHLQPTHARWEKINDEAEDQTEGSHRLPILDPVYARNFRIHDLCLETAPDSTLTSPGINLNEINLQSIPPHILEELPAECLEALHAAQQRENAWRSKWSSEKTDGLRAHFLPSIEWYPK